MEILRTPDDRFDAIPGFQLAPHYAELGELRMADTSSRRTPARSSPPW
jgi:hypothetical protein